jgi:hypothetical protein
LSVFVYIIRIYGKLYKNCTKGNGFEREIIMTESKSDRIINESINFYRSWYRGISCHSFSNKAFIVPWQIPDENDESDYPEENELSKK